MPTPVSALIHAATLVTAGLYLLLRSSPLLEYSSTVLLFITLLFLGAGAVIHSFSDQQDVRRFGGLIKFLPFTYTAMLVGSLSLLATPCLTAFYSFRLICLVFLTIPNGPKQSYLNVHEANNKVIIPLFLLALFSIFFGFIFSDLFVGMASDFFSNALFIKPNNISLIEAEFSLPLIIKLLPALLSLFGASLAIFLYHKSPTFIIDLTDNFIGQNLYTFFNGKYFFDIIYNNYFINKGLDLGYKISK